MQLGSYGGPQAMGPGPTFGGPSGGPTWMIQQQVVEQQVALPMQGGMQGAYVVQQHGGAPGCMPGGYMVQQQGGMQGCMPGGYMVQQQVPLQAESCDVFLEVLPEIVPGFDRGPNGTFVMEVPPVRVRLQTTCSPQLPVDPGLMPYKPYEEFYVTLPEVQRICFNPHGGGTQAVCQTQKSGALLEAPRRVTLNCQCKANSPYGSLILEDIQTVNGYSQKIGENALHYRLQVDAEMAVNRGGGNAGSNRLEVLLSFSFTAQLSLGGGAPQALPPEIGPMMYGPGGFPY